MISIVTEQDKSCVIKSQERVILRKIHPWFENSL